MSRRILFSPVGGTDPMPQTNFRDGSLLHICRVYKPTDVYLYMSEEILRLHEKDNRYLYCLECLAKKQKRKMHYEILARPDLKNVQFFDTFYQDFRQEIQKITSNMDEKDTLIFNVSSGTPAMKSGLVVLATLGEYPYQLVQVRTPLGRMNEHRHENYDVKTLWELNEDNEEEFENRCQEVKCPSLSILKQEEIIKKLIRSYDYEAAREVSKTLPEDVTHGYYMMLELACSRLQLDFPAMNRLDKETGAQCIPIKDDKKQKYFEYILSLGIKKEKHEYLDFIRAITPIIVDLFEMILKHECKINIEKYCFTDPLEWDPKRLKGTDLDNILQESFRQFRYGIVYSAHLACIIEEKCQKNKKLVMIVQALRAIEKKVRNPAAHEIVSLSDDRIKKKTGYDVHTIMELIKNAFRFTGIEFKDTDWESYDRMNEKIIQRINQ